ncbi:hypothetical protein DAKH74_040970 [Maudiozyma humilis]|uniref:Retrovirus-related Pol polyprotein from transposon TNT 1-94-like beta-barrel domain-containing protein n=1 Tax=Maudiozyma humilis TaxID=51915 RepID=A0AAV5S1A0_MAUHU|nr:hypothetical protein DAKH74_040970 [Kazachstania humilis]
MASNINCENQPYSIPNLCQQITSPDVLDDDPFGVKLAGAENYHLWFKRLRHHLLSAALELSEYARTGDIQCTVNEFHMDTTTRDSVISMVNNSLIEIIKNSTVGDPHKTVMDALTYNTDETGKTLLDKMKELYSKPTVYSTVMKWNELFNCSSESVHEKVDLIKSVTRDVFDLRAIAEEVGPTDQATVDKLADKLSQKHDEFMAYLLIALSPDDQENCIDHLGANKSITLAEVKARIALRTSLKSHETHTPAVPNTRKPKKKRRNKHSQCGVCGGAYHPLRKCELLRARMPNAPIFQSEPTNNSNSSDRSSSCTVFDMNADDLMLGDRSDPIAEDGKSDWVICNGFTVHACVDKSLFTDFQPSQGTTLSGAAGGAPILGYGNVTVGHITLQNTAYVPSLPVNIFSIQRTMSRCNYDLQHSGTELHFVDQDGRRILLGTAKDGLYHLNTST